MNNAYDRSINLAKLLAGLVVVFIGACTTNEPLTNDTESTLITEVDVAPAEPSATPPVAPDSAEPEQSVKETPPEPPVVIVISDDSPAYANVASELVRRLENTRVYTLPDNSADIIAIYTEINEENPSAVVAIGLSSALVAKHYSGAPVVFCQVFNVAANDLISDRVKGVSSIPPLSAQLDVWKQLDPDLSSIGIILGDEHDAVVDEAADATTAAGMRLLHRIAKSDRETLYHFKRVVTDIDGFWLFPDNRILSPGVIREIFAHAAHKNVQIAVFNPALLSLGATVSFSASDSDIALTVLSVLERIADSDTASIPAMTPLSTMDIKVNDAASANSLNPDVGHPPDTRTSARRQ